MWVFGLSNGGSHGLTLRVHVWFGAFAKAWVQRVSTGQIDVPRMARGLIETKVFVWRLQRFGWPWVTYISKVLSSRLVRKFGLLFLVELKTKVHLSL